MQQLYLEAEAALTTERSARERAELDVAALTSQCSMVNGELADMARRAADAAATEKGVSAAWVSVIAARLVTAVETANAESDELSKFGGALAGMIANKESNTDKVAIDFAKRLGDWKERTARAFEALLQAPAPNHPYPTPAASVVCPPSAFRSIVLC